jgi:CCR4-NOT transcription complex subunit 6
MMIIDGGCRDKIMVVNTHIHWDPEYSDVKLMQVQILLEKLEDAMVSVSNRSASERAGGGRGRPLPNNTILQATKEIPLLIAGDFNSIPESGVYKLMSERSVDGSHPDFQNFSYGKYTTQGMKHSLNLGSSYNDIVGEPSFTNYTGTVKYYHYHDHLRPLSLMFALFCCVGDFVGVLDYVWYSKSCLQVERVLSPVEEPVVLAQNGALPNPYMCSDHIPLLADFSLNA